MIKKKTRVLKSNCDKRIYLENGDKMKKRISIFGSTGSIGTSTLNVIRTHKDLFEVSTLVAGENIGQLIEQIKEFQPEHVYIKSEENAKRIKSEFEDLDVYYGMHGIKDISNLTDFDIAVSALVGIARLRANIQHD